MAAPPLQRPKQFPSYVRLSASSSSPFTSPTLSPPTPFARHIERDASSSSLTSMDSPYLTPKRPLSLGDNYDLSHDPRRWGADLSPEFKEPDDDLHGPERRTNSGKLIEHDGHFISWRGLMNLGSLILLCLLLVTFFAGYPIITHFTTSRQSNLGGFNLGGINGSGQVPAMPGHFYLIDRDTPKDAYTVPSWNNPSRTMELVFSDEFNQDGRSFYPGDDPYWEAVDLHYWGTNNLEWYDPEAVTTRDGNLVVTLSRKNTHNLQYEGGMISTWNKFCFTGGYIEASVMLPGANNIMGLWPAIWTLGNLGRAGYGATLDGMWPYSYDSCDVGTVANQTVNGQPVAATQNGDPSYGGALSFLPGQRLSRCTCPGANEQSGELIHPGPKHSDGTFVGRAAPEIDVFEAQVHGRVGEVSQSSQFAPFNEGYHWFNTSDNMYIADPTISELNTYQGSVWQQATSVVTQTDQNCYELALGCFSIYGFEYQPGFDDGYITWVSDSKIAWTLNAAGMAADPAVEIGARPIPQEPMYILVNLGMSYNFGNVDLEHLTFPARMHVDYIRVYQDPDRKNIGCDPPDFPTADYINQHIGAYNNPNLTTWVDDYGQVMPPNSFLGQC